MWGIKAVFQHNSNPSLFNYTYYDEVTYETRFECLNAINGERGELLSQASSIDCENEEDLFGFHLSDLEPYVIGEEK